MPPRLTRKEKQAHTRSSLMKSAARVFCRKGLERASIDEVAEDAGYTKGAFYANFRSKEELHLAMMDDRFADRIEEVDRAFADGESAIDQARHAAADFARSRGPEDARLFLEFSSYALKDERFREELLTRHATLHERLGAVYSRRMEEYGIEPPIPVDRMVRMIVAMVDGWSLWQLLDPDAIDDDMLETMMEIFTIGIGIMGGLTPESEQPSRRSAAPR